MLQIFLAVLAIVMAALIAVANVSSIDTAGPVRKATRLQVEGSQAALLRAFDAYRVANGGAAPDVSDVQDGVPAAIAAYLAAPPAAPAGMAWTYAADASGDVYACVSGTQVSRAVQDGLGEVPAYDPSQALTRSCTDTSAPTGYDGQAALRFALH